mgnify:CR=1 FL=1
MLTDTIICVGIGIGTYMLLYLNKLQNIRENINSDEKIRFCIEKYNISLKIPLIISIIFWFILKKIKDYNHNIISDLINSIEDVKKVATNIDVYTDNMSHFL